MMLKRLLLAVLLLPFVVPLQAESQQYPGVFDSHPVQNDPPVWTSTPTPQTTQGVGGVYDLSPDLGDPDGDPLTITLNVGSAALPTGVTISGTTLVDNGTGTPGTTTNIILDADDGVNDPEASPAFSYVISAGGFAAMSPAYETALEGFACPGCNWETFFASDPDIVIRRVTNLNLSGAGSFDNSISNCGANEWRISVYETSGMPNYPDASPLKNSDCSHLTVVFPSGPSPGFHIRDLPIQARGSTHQVWMHLSQFGGTANSQAAGKCFTINEGATSVSNIVVINGGCNFAYDGSFEVYHNSNNTTYIQTMFLNPIGYGTGPGRFGMLWGDDSGDSDNGLLARNVFTHATGRNPKVNGVRHSAMVNNVFFDAQNNFTEITKGDGGGLGFLINIEDNLYIDGPATPANLIPIWVRDTVEAGTQIWLAGNRTSFLNANDNNQDNLLDDQDGTWTRAGARISSAWPAGFVDTPIGAGIQGEQDFADLICRHAGPRPNDRLAIYQQACDEIENRYDGSGSQGIYITSVGQHSLGIPSIAVNTCDLDVPNDCGPNKPALPSPPTVENMRQWINDMHCAVSAAGATGC